MSNLDETDILGYKPDLNIYSRPSGNYFENTDLENDDDVEGVDTSASKSSILDEFQMHRPSSKIMKGNEVLSEIDKKLKYIEDNVRDNEITQGYFSSGVDVNKIKLDHNNVNDVQPLLEIHDMLSKMKEEIKDALDYFTTAIYGKDVDANTAEQIDKAIMGKMEYFEEIEEYEKVNYFALYYDTQVSYLMGDYFYKMLEIVEWVDFIDNDSKDIPMTAVTQNMFIEKYNNIAGESEKYVFNNSFSKEYVKNGLHNMFVLKDKVNMYFETFSSLFKLGDEYEIVDEIRQDNTKELNTKVEDLVKVLHFSYIVKEDLLKNIENKIKIINFLKL